MASKKDNTAPKAAKGLKKQSPMPTKTTINLAFHESSFHPKKMLPLLLVLIIAAGLFVKFGFLDQYAKKTAALQELGWKQDNLTIINSKLQGYDELAEKYGRYSYGWMTETEASYVERPELLNLIQNKLIYKSIVEDYSINGNVISVHLKGITLDQAKSIVQDLEKEEIVESALVYTAKTEDDSQLAKVYMAINVKKEEAE